LATRNSKLKLLFDETIGHPIANAIIEVLKFDQRFDLDAVTMCNFAGKGAKDPHWIILAKKQKRLVITGDRGRKKDGAPLDLLLPYNGVTGVFMTGQLHSGRPQLEKARAIISLWPHIVETADETPGKRFKMRIAGKSFSLEEWPLNVKSQERMNQMSSNIPDCLF